MCKKNTGLDYLELARRHTKKADKFDCKAQKMDAKLERLRAKGNTSCCREKCMMRCEARRAEYAAAASYYRKAAAEAQMHKAGANEGQAVLLLKEKDGELGNRSSYGTALPTKVELALNVE